MLDAASMPCNNDALRMRQLGKDGGCRGKVSFFRSSLQLGTPAAYLRPHHCLTTIEKKGAARCHSAALSNVRRRRSSGIGVPALCVPAPRSGEHDARSLWLLATRILHTSS